MSTWPNQPASLLGENLPDPLPDDPIGLFVSWFDAAQRARTVPNPNAFTLATVDPDGRPSARIVLCKHIDSSAATITFFTNYNGRKARALEENRRAAAVFHWDHASQQVRIEGPVIRSSDEQSDTYFNSRPWLSRLGAWASDQSEPIASRGALVAQLRATFERFGLDPDDPPAPDAKVDIPRPAHWGGYQLVIERAELWVSGTGRLHDRAGWIRTEGGWVGGRLQP